MPAPARRGDGEREPRRTRQRDRADGQRADRAPRNRRRPPNRAQPTAPAAPRKRSDLLGRVLIAVPAAVLAVGFVDLGGLGWALLAGAMGAACVYELYAMLGPWRPLPVVGIAAVIGMCLGARYGGEHAMIGAAVASVPVTFLALIARGPAPRPTLAIASTLLGVFWIGFAVAHGVLLRDLPHGNGLTIDVLVGTFMADTCAYFGGRIFGRRPLAPDISPNKTVEGLLFGMFAAIIAVFCAALYQPWLGHGQALALGVAIAIAGPLGDLFESLLKRDAGTKDAGKLFGAHGGALDRLDALSFTLVACYYVWMATGH